MMRFTTPLLFFVGALPFALISGFVVWLAGGLSPELALVLLISGGLWAWILWVIWRGSLAQAWWAAGTPALIALTIGAVDNYHQCNRLEPRGLCPSNASMTIVANVIAGFICAFPVLVTLLGVFFVCFRIRHALDGSKYPGVAHSRWSE